MIWIDKSGLLAGVFPALEIIAPRLRLFFFSRVGGVSPPPFDSLNTSISTGDLAENVNRNRELILDSIDISENALAVGEQVHSRTIRSVGGGGNFSKTDGFITASEGVGLAVSTADCCPVFIYSPQANALAALHVGRKGAAAGIVTSAAEKLSSEFGVSLELAVAVIGPSICGNCYRVNREIAGRFGSSAGVNEEGEYYLDLPGFVQNQLALSGIPTGKILRPGICTCCDSEHCFSHRRDRGRTGRHWSIAFMADG